MTQWQGYGVRCSTLLATATMAVLVCVTTKAQTTPPTAREIVKSI